MCQIDGTDVMVAKEEIALYRVQLSFEGKLYQIYNRKIESTAMDFIYDSLNVWDHPIPHRRTFEATGFHESLGFMGFLTLEVAEEYLKAYNKSHFYQLSISKRMQPVIVKFTIPKGARYALGRVDHGFVGAGISSIRTDTIRIGRRPKIWT